MTTDAMMLAAAKKRLAEHLAMRPITIPELLAFAADLERRSQLARADAEASEGLRFRMQQDLADSYAKRAAIFRNLAAMPEKQAYEATTAHLQARADFYQNRVNSGCTVRDPGL